MGFTSDLLDTVTFKGLSSTTSRFIAAAVSLVIWVLSVLFVVALSFRLGNAGTADQVGLALVSIILISYTLSGRFLLFEIANWLAFYTPVGVLCRSDRKVLDKARREILELARHQSLANFLPYSTINPAVAHIESFEVIRQQDAGVLREWLNEAENLNKAAHLVYQIALVEQAIAAGDYPRPNV